ncbi:hypothetical protein PPL_09113 [Heterostelium album PN500]|uniref:Uncharacterized protein n=1 Tax=Heterostelium pallidum (strain ATCC 26659 / Pp 5 / PN500) TaxID=670386 RepID=D3BKN1_HETP5|nr:hypothetical protein PPL_09113 [Heterostelium album PN500]EFA78461.1 hypothetical protein PPL_09113 [Heterostelium album PN500]|eukprot:XP_020430585.1 hypothetical protein PPL_09113 [Heterostelium album PN500]
MTLEYMDSLLPELETFNLIHPTCVSTTSHQLKQREILASQPLVLFELLDDDDDEDDEEITNTTSKSIHTINTITTDSHSATNDNNTSKQEDSFKPSHKCLQHRYSSEFIFNPISKKSVSPSPLQHESSFSPIADKKRKRDSDEQENNNLNNNNNNNNNNSNNNINNNSNNNINNNSINININSFLNNNNNNNNSNNNSSINFFFPSNPSKYLKSLKQPKIMVCLKVETISIKFAQYVGDAIFLTLILGTYLRYINISTYYLISYDEKVIRKILITSIVLFSIIILREIFLVFQYVQQNKDNNMILYRTIDSVIYIILNLGLALVLNRKNDSSPKNSKNSNETFSDKNRSNDVNMDQIPSSNPSPHTEISTANSLDGMYSCVDEVDGIQTNSVNDEEKNISSDNNINSSVASADTTPTTTTNSNT